MAGSRLSSGTAVRARYIRKFLRCGLAPKASTADTTRARERITTSLSMVRNSASTRILRTRLRSVPMTTTTSSGRSDSESSARAFRSWSTARRRTTTCCSEPIRNCSAPMVRVLPISRATARSLYRLSTVSSRGRTSTPAWDRFGRPTASTWPISARARTQFVW